MKIQKIIYSPIAPVVITGILLIIGFWHGDVVLQRNDADFEPDVYNATVIQVGGVGSDIYTNRAYYIGDGSGKDHQEGWPTYLDKDVYAPVSFNTPFSLMDLSCKEGYKATLLPDEISDSDAWREMDNWFRIEIKEKVKNQLSIRCEKPLPQNRVKEIIAEECKRIVDYQSEHAKSGVLNNKTAVEIIKEECLLVLDSSIIADFNGDNKNEIAMITSGAGCGSCHAQEIRIIKDDKVIFYKNGSDFTIKLTNNPIGFILEYPEKSLPPSPGDEYVIEGYKAIKGEGGLESFYRTSLERKKYEFE